MGGDYSYSNLLRDGMEGHLGKKSIHTSDSFLHSNYCGIMVSEYTTNIAYLYFCYMLIVMSLLLSIKCIKNIMTACVSCRLYLHRDGLENLIYRETEGRARSQKISTHREVNTADRKHTLA